MRASTACLAGRQAGRAAQAGSGKLRQATHGAQVDEPVAEALHVCAMPSIEQHDMVMPPHDSPGEMQLRTGGAARVVSFAESRRCSICVC